MKEVLSRRKKIVIISVLLVVLLCACALVGTLLAWLKDDEELSTEGNLQLGSVNFVIYNGANAVASNSEISLSGSTAIRNVNISVRNTGTVDALMRVTIRLYYKDSSGSEVPFTIKENPSLQGEAHFNALGWVYRMGGGIDSTTLSTGGGVTSGQMFYNSIISPYTSRRPVTNPDGSVTVKEEDVSANAVNIMTQVLLSSKQASDTIYLRVSVEGIAYSGNIYGKLEKGETSSSDIPVTAYPFGTLETLPSDWVAYKLS